LAAVDLSFAARRAAILATARPSDLFALLRALSDEQTLARRNARDRWRVETVAQSPNTPRHDLASHLQTRAASLEFGSGHLS